MELYTTDGKVRHFSKKEGVNEKLCRILGKEFRKYRNRWDAVNRFEIETDFPLFLQVDVNQICNFRCPHCIIGNKALTQKTYPPDSMDFEAYRKVVFEGGFHGCPSISPQGNNEPLLFNVEDYISLARDHGFIDIMINTNASLLTEERAKKLLDSGLTRIRFSIDAASPETFEKVRVGGNYEKVLNNILKFLAVKEKGGYSLPVVGVNFCKISTNEHEENQFFDFWEDKVDIVSIQRFMPPVFDKDYSEYAPRGTEERSESFYCPQPWQRVTIRNHVVTPCCSMEGLQLSLGDIRVKSIKKMWDSWPMRELRRLHKEGRYYDNEICLKCVKSMGMVSKFPAGTSPLR